MDYFDRVCARQNTKIKITNELVSDIWNKRIDLLMRHKIKRLTAFYPAFFKAIKDVDSGHEYTNHDIQKTDYWNFLRRYHKSWQQEPLTDRARRQIKHKFMDGVNLYFDIKLHGMINPLDMITEKGHTCLYRGYRRLVILKVLETKTAKVRYAICQ